MCCIMGYAGRDLPKETFTEYLLRTTSRGPDDQRVAETEFGLLGLAVLAIMGLTPEGMQPFFRGADCVACNGELYGFRPVKAELEAEGYTFESDSDCEIILPLYYKYGLDMFRHLDAEFAMILYDSRKKLLIAGAVVLAVLILLMGAFFRYVSDYYRAEDVALAVLSGENGITVQDDLTILSPSAPTDTAIIFYPGAKVEAQAYLPLLDQIRRTGITCILVEMPFNMAIFDSNAAEGVMEQFPEVEHWYIAGHSMGGAMASQFASNHPDEADGLILLGAYIYGDYSPADTLTVYGSLNQSVEDKLDYTENVVEIEGGNHAQFGN